MEQAFHTLLENLEEMKLPEGDYLKMTNILKSAFDKRDAEKDSNTFIPTTPLVVKLAKNVMKTIEIEFEIKKAEGGPRMTTFIEVRTKNIKTGNVITRQETRNLVCYPKTKGIDSFVGLLRSHIERFRPLQIQLTMEGVDTQYTYEELKEHEEEEDKEMGFDEEEMAYDYRTLFVNVLSMRIEEMIAGWVSSCREF